MLRPAWAVRSSGVGGQGVEKEPTGSMGRGAAAGERRAEEGAAREGRAYGPVTAVGQHNAGVVERAGLRQYIERGTEWLRDMGQRIAGRLHDVAASLSGAVERDRREAAEVQLAREAQERLAADRARQEAQERQQVRERERVAEKFNTIAGKREAGAHGYGDHNSDWRSEEHTSELQSLMRSSYAVFCLKKKNKTQVTKVYFSIRVNLASTHPLPDDVFYHITYTDINTHT